MPASSFAKSRDRDRNCGLIVLGDDGVVAHATQTARHWIREYFGAKGFARLPELLREWTAPSGRRQVTSAPGRPRHRALAVERKGRRLLVRVISDGRRRFLLLEEEIPPRMAGLEAPGLTPRETEVLSWLAAGKTNHEIGSILGISPRTVKKHLEHVYGKLGVETRTAAVAVALALGSAAEPGVASRATGTIGLRQAPYRHTPPQALHRSLGPGPRPAIGQERTSINREDR